MVEQLSARIETEKAETWLKLLTDNGCLKNNDLVAPQGRRLEIAFANDKIGPIHPDHGLTKARIEGLFVRKEHLENVTYFRLDQILSVTIGRER